MRLLGLFEDPEGPSAHLRFHVFVRDAEHATVVAHALPRQRAERRALLRRARDFDVVFVQRRLLLPWDLAVLRRAARRLVYDFDDALPYRDHAPHSSLARRLKFRAWMRAADQVIAGSEELAALARHRGGAAVVVPTVVPLGRLAGTARRPGELLWVGQPSTARYLEDLLPALRGLAGRCPGLRLTVLGAPGPGALAELDFVRVAPWTPEREEEALGRAVVGLAPLPDNPWTRGKCGARLLRYLGAGMRAVASPVGAQERIARVCGAVELVPHLEDWGPALERALRAGPLDPEGGRALRERVAAEYSPEAWRSRWWQAVLGVAPPAARG